MRRSRTRTYKTFRHQNPITLNSSVLTDKFRIKAFLSSAFTNSAIRRILKEKILPVSPISLSLHQSQPYKLQNTTLNGGGAGVEPAIPYELRGGFVRKDDNPQFFSPCGQNGALPVATHPISLIIDHLSFVEKARYLG